MSGLAAAGAIAGVFIGVAGATAALLRSEAPARVGGTGRWQVAIGRGPGQLVPAAVVDALLRRETAAGEPWGHDPDHVRGVIATCMIGVGAVAGLLAAMLGGAAAGIPIGVAGACVGAALPFAELAQRTAARARAIAAAMSFAADLIALALRAGAPVDRALAGYADHARDPVLPEEIARVNAALGYGETRGQAFAALRRRAPCPEIDELVRLIDDASTLGVPLAERLDDLAQRLEQAAADRAEADAAAATDLMTAPITLLAMSFVVVILAPFIAQMGRFGG